MTRKAGPKPELISRGANRTAWPPACGQCLNDDGTPGFVGEPDDTQSPYLACNGNPDRHQRTPLRTGVQA